MIQTAHQPSLLRMLDMIQFRFWLLQLTNDPLQPHTGSIASVSKLLAIIANAETIAIFQDELVILQDQVLADEVLNLLES